MSTFDSYGVKVLLILCYFVLEIRHHVASYIDKVEHSLFVYFSQVPVLGCVDCRIPKEGLHHYLFYVFGCFLVGVYHGLVSKLQGWSSTMGMGMVGSV
jgi:hypothetical protein